MGLGGSARFEEVFHTAAEVGVEALGHFFEHLGAFAVFRGGSLGFEAFPFPFHAFFEGVFHFEEGFEEFFGGARSVDPFDEGFLEWFVLGEMEEASFGEVFHVFLVGLEVGFAFAIEADFFAIDEGIVGAGFREELHDEGNGIDEHEEEGEDEVGGEGEAAAFISDVEEFVEGEGLGEEVAAWFRADGGDAFGFVVGEGGDFFL